MELQCVELQIPSATNCFLTAPGFNPTLEPEMRKTVSKFAFKWVNLCCYNEEVTERERAVGALKTEAGLCKLSSVDP